MDELIEQVAKAIFMRNADRDWPHFLDEEVREICREQARAAITVIIRSKKEADKRGDESPSWRPGPFLSAWLEAERRTNETGGSLFAHAADCFREMK